jgi:hypothetical protein
MSQTQEMDKDLSKDIEESKPTSQDTQDVPSWSEIFSQTSDIGIKKSIIGYSIGSGSIFLASMFLLPFTIGFSASLFLISFLTGFVGKADIVGSGATGFVGGGLTSIITAGLAALTLSPIFTGAFIGLIAGIVGVLAGGFVRRKLKDS